jgi:hypothetical protein
VYRLHQHLIGVRRRYPWLRTAHTAALQLANRQYVYQSRNGADAVVVALNVDDTPLPLSLADLGLGDGRIVAGSGAPRQDVIARTEVPPHGWVILAAGS